MKCHKEENKITQRRTESINSSSSSNHNTSIDALYIFSKKANRMSSNKSKSNKSMYFPIQIITLQSTKTNLFANSEETKELHTNNGAP